MDRGLVYLFFKSRYKLKRRYYRRWVSYTPRLYSGSHSCRIEIFLKWPYNRKGATFLDITEEKWFAD
jgi:hypothetical protein